MTRYSRLPAAALQSPGVRLHAPGKQISEAAARLAAALARRSAGEQRGAVVKASYRIRVPDGVEHSPAWPPACVCVCVRSEELVGNVA